MALVVFTGGVRSGKSAAAQDLAAERQRQGARVVVAVFGRGDADAEMAGRISRHQDDRPSGFETLEAAGRASWTGAVPEDALLVVDCLGTLLGGVIEEVLAGSEPAELGAAASAAVEDRFAGMVEWLAGRQADTIVVTNEVGDGIVPAYPSGRLFRDLLGRANRSLVDAADRAYLVVCGRIVELSALSARASWPQD